LDLAAFNRSRVWFGTLQLKSLLQVAPNNAIAQRSPTIAQQGQDIPASYLSLAASAPSARNVEHFPESGTLFLQTQRLSSSALEGEFSSTRVLA
jgi:hypothetical protein